MNLETLKELKLTLEDVGDKTLLEAVNSEIALKLEAIEKLKPKPQPLHEALREYFGINVSFNFYSQGITSAEATLCIPEVNETFTFRVTSYPDGFLAYSNYDSDYDCIRIEGKTLWEVVMGVLKTRLSCIEEGIEEKEAEIKKLSFEAGTIEGWIKANESRK